MVRQFFMSLGAVATLALAGAGAQAQQYPTRPVTIVVPFAAGGPTDIVARSMALAGKTVLVSGAPDTIDEEYAFERLAAKDPAILQELKEQDEALEGRRGAKMWAVNTETGEQSTGLELTSPPVWDGMVVARGSLFVATVDGRLKCFSQ